MFGPSQGRQWQARAIASLSKDRALRLSIFGAAISLVIAVALAGTGFIAARNDRERSKSELLLLQAQTLANTVDLEVAQAVAVLRGLATSNPLASGDFGRLQTDMQEAGDGAGASICLVDSNGQVLGAMAAPGSPPAPGRMRIHDFLDAITGGQAGAPNLSPNTFYGVNRLDVVYPLTDRNVGNKHLGALVYSIAPHRLIALMTSRHLPRHTTVNIIDPRGIIAASTTVPDQAGQPASPELMATLMGKDQGKQALAGDGQLMLLAWAKAPQTKIEVAITSPPPPLLSALGRTLKPAAIFLALCLFAITASLVLYRRTIDRSGKQPAAAAAESQHAGTSTAGVQRQVSPTEVSPSEVGRSEVSPSEVSRDTATEAAGEQATPLPLSANGAEPIRQTSDARDLIREQSLHAQRLEFMGTLASGVAHDFGNVLQALDGSVRLIRDNPSDIPAVEHSTGVMLDVLGGARSVVRRLLSFAREDGLERADHAVEPTLSGLVDILRSALPRQVEIKLDVTSGLPPMRVDKFRLEATMLNLAMNAQHAMPEGGTLTISARRDQAPQSQTGQGDAGLAEGEYIRIDTADTGTGMSAEVLARATEAFFTTKPVGQGTGLGLSSARSFADESGGALRISSEPGRGTTVSLWLPQADCAPGNETKSHESEDKPVAIPAPAVSVPALIVSNPAPVVSTEVPGPQRILLVDDEPMIRDVLARQLARRGMTVKVCADAAEALAALGSSQAFDLLLTDFAMPDMAGDVLVAEARKLRAGLPVIVLTGHPHDAEVLGERTADSRLRLLSKPISGRELADEIDQLLGRMSGT